MAVILTAALLYGCQEIREVSEIERMGFPIPEGEIPFTLRAGSVGDAETRGELFGEADSELRNKAIQLLCFDASGYYIGIRQAYIGTPNGNNPSTSGTFSGYVPEGTARIHFVANLGLPEDIGFPVGTSENVVMQSPALSSGFQDPDPQNESIYSVKFWGYKRFDSAYEMKQWLTQGETKTVMLLRDRARITLSIPPSVLEGFDSIEWTVFNGRDRGYVAPYDYNYADHNESDPWSGYYPNNHYYMTEFEESQRYSVSNSDSFTSINEPQYVFDDGNVKGPSGEDGRIRILLKVKESPNASPKYILLLLRDGDGEQMPITRNNTYNIVVRGLTARGYSTLEEAIDPDANDFGNAPPEVDPSVPSVSDGEYTLELKTPGSIVVVRDLNDNTIPVSFTFKRSSDQSDPYASVADETALRDFYIGWQDNDQQGWQISNPQHTNNTNRPWEFNLTIGTIGDTYAFEDYLVIRHKESGLSRTVHVYAVEAFQYRVAPTLDQVVIDGSPYMGPSGDDVERPVFALRFQLPESLHEDMFPLTVRLASSNLEPYGDDNTSYTSSKSGGYALQTTSTAESLDGTPLTRSNLNSDWNYKSDEWGFWYCYTLDEYPEDGEVVIYLKDIRDARAQASSQDLGLYVDISDFIPVGVMCDSDDVMFPSYGYGTVDGEYTVSWRAARYRLSLTRCAAGTYTISEEPVNPLDPSSQPSWLEEAASSVTVSEDDGKLNLIISVHENGSQARQGVIVFTNETTGVQTKVTVIQEPGPNDSIR